MPYPSTNPTCPKKRHATSSPNNSIEPSSPMLNKHPMPSPFPITNASGRKKTLSVIKFIRSSWPVWRQNTPFTMPIMALSMPGSPTKIFSPSKEKRLRSNPLHPSFFPSLSQEIIFQSRNNSLKFCYNAIRYETLVSSSIWVTWAQRNA